MLSSLHWNRMYPCLCDRCLFLTHLLLLCFWGMMGRPMLLILIRTDFLALVLVCSIECFLWDFYARGLGFGFEAAPHTRIGPISSSSASWVLWSGTYSVFADSHSSFCRFPSYLRSMRLLSSLRSHVGSQLTWSFAAHCDGPLYRREMRPYS